MGAFSTAAKNDMLDALTIDRIRMHSAAPGVDGTTSPLGSLTACTFAAASSASRALSAAVEFTGLGVSQACGHFSVWDNNGGSPIFLGSGEVTTGDTSANAAGEFSLTTSTEVTLTDPA